MSNESNGELDTAQVEQEVIEQEETTDAQEEESTTSEETSQEDAQSEKPKKHGAEKRIAQLTWKLREQERKLEELQNKQPPKQETSVPKPTLESVGYDESKYAEAMETYLAAQIDAKVESKLTAKEQESASRKAQEDYSRKRDDFFSKGLAIADDFADVISDESLPVTTAMVDALFSVEKGPEILYHLANNTAELYRIAELSPFAQAVEIGRLEARFSMPKPKTSSNAPPPVKPITAGGETATKDPDQMTTKQWLAWREKQLKHG